ncbi:hypothetical protein [Gemmatimonas groenlandica]|uniref:Uncharacterized protein n=1 Tax=Gemmatimonas groenlandica TaxID=2732249 RepID=A0A6M4ISN6_9BACT|nr:hypothetical protein [Gemmatimonas groenlandica]QJR36739.1 hypothetical protein HKW67_15060 [Gemmatimonas groenlandica]
MDRTSFDLTELTIVLGPPTHLAAQFAEFQARAAAGDIVTEHEWAQHEYAALDALTHREGSVKTHTILETMLSSVLGADVIVLDVDRKWVRAEDGQLYTALSMCSEDIRSRAEVASLSAPAFLEALNTAAVTIAQLDGREWIRWSSRAWTNEGTRESVERAAQLVVHIADAVVGSAPAAADAAQDDAARDDEAIDLATELVQAIGQGREAAGDEGGMISQQLRGLRFVDPLRAEWSNVTADALYVGALDMSLVRHRVSRQDAAGLAFLYLGKQRAEQLKQSGEITPRFRREIIAKTFMTSYALERLAPQVSRELFAFMSTR